MASAIYEWNSPRLRAKFRAVLKRCRGDDLVGMHPQQAGRYLERRLLQESGVELHLKTLRRHAWHYTLPLAWARRLPVTEMRALLRRIAAAGFENSRHLTVTALWVAAWANVVGSPEAKRLGRTWLNDASAAVSRTSRASPKRALAERLLRDAESRL